jgi:hypothetical protein
MLLLVGCGGGSQAVDTPTPETNPTEAPTTVPAATKAPEVVSIPLKTASSATPTSLNTANFTPVMPTPTDIELNSVMKEELLALANNRDAWFLASDITTEALEGLYGSWSVICRNQTSLADYKEVV